ncbi:MAG: hypothetical protein COV07_00205 [Candidatus Vogelbacteria bacterium CG10_big_fil_rev_8_21_14_0_10_45_14]|uniref:SpoVT-AbrB domain-containing protein n=1 Tax=Candidatus Vogelbacteria bacterium CG10_big_fil_rev_8_21_14_0_10_45_14 TaxID=1975042 RepID=A0A2H0RL68_9BACT|nr:MAG: hypothetical protein COV07_00205 [Candidatus Vogelbacteria bacterium CG10_big_fil_rev_8_21_14_0_10_45_14]
MSTTTTTISSKYQIVLPRDTRDSTNFRIGKKVSLTRIDENHVVLSTQDEAPMARLRRLRGMGKGLSGSKKEIDGYLNGERNSWDK